MNRSPNSGDWFCFLLAILPIINTQTQQSYYSQILYLQTYLLAKISLLPQINTPSDLRTFTQIVQSRQNFSCSWVPSWGEPADALSSCFLSCPFNKCPFHSFLGAAFFTFLYFLVVISLNSWPRDSCEEVLPKVTSTRRLWCPLEESIGLAKVSVFSSILEKNPKANLWSTLRVLGKLQSDMSYHAISSEFKGNESKTYIK